MTTGDPHPMDPRRSGSGPRPGARPARRRGLLPLVPLIGVGWALAEIWLLLLLGEAAGGWTVFGVLLAGVVLGVLVIRRAGRRAWRRLTEAVQQQQAGGAVPETAERDRGGDGLAMAGGLLLITPGLLSDALGLLCVLPPTAALLRGAGRRLLSTGAGPLGTAYQQARAAEERRRMRRPDGGRIVPGEVVRESEEDEEDDGGGPGGPGPGPAGR